MQEIKVNINREERTINVQDPLVEDHEILKKKLYDMMFCKDDSEGKLKAYQDSEYKILKDLTGLTKEEIQKMTVKDKRKVLEILYEGFSGDMGFQKTSVKAQD